MPQFILNEDAIDSHPYHGLNDFAKGYVEAMFFTNGDMCDDDEGRLNSIGVEGLTARSIENIAADCANFEEEAADILDEVTAGASSYDMRRAGNDFWFTRQGHGTGFWDRTELQFDDVNFGGILSKIAKTFGEVYVEIGDDGLINY